MTTQYKNQLGYCGFFYNTTAMFICLCLTKKIIHWAQFKGLIITKLVFSSTVVCHLIV